MILVAAMVVCANATAQDDMHPSLSSKYWITVGGYYPDHSVSLSVEGANQIVNKEIHFEGAVDLSERKALLTAELGWQFDEKWAVTTQHFETERSRNFVLQEDIEWDDLIFEVGVDVSRAPTHPWPVSTFREKCLSLATTISDLARAYTE